jgi:hypothetical protein
MTRSIPMLAVLTAGALFATAAVAAGEGAMPFIAPIAGEPAPRLIVRAPIAEGLTRGAALIPYRVENMRLLPVLGAAALGVSPRVGHLHVTVDGLPWHWADFSGDEVLVVVGFEPGPHKVLIEVADAQHRVVAAETVAFTITGAARPAHAH